MDAILKRLQKQQPQMLRMLQRFVEAESPTTDKAAVDRFGKIVAEAVAARGGQVRFITARQSGDHLRAEFRFGAGRAAGQLLLLGHLDTVWERGTPARMPFRIRRGRAYGPGVFDMKAGIMMALFALEALQAERIAVQKKVVLLLNADEESSSPSSRAVTEKEARRSGRVLVLEPAFGPQGAVKTARKGVGEFRIRVTGRAAHAGLDPENGASAVAELAAQVLRVTQFADAAKGITVNPGVISGGTRSNVVAAEATALVDVRVARSRDLKALEKRFRELRPIDPRTRLEVTGGFHRPPLERTPQVAALFEQAKGLAASLGIALEEAAVGGGSDGCFTAALGIPTLDGLGAVGEGAHAEHENVLVRELPRRAALLAHLIAAP